MAVRVQSLRLYPQTMFGEYHGENTKGNIFEWADYTHLLANVQDRNELEIALGTRKFDYVILKHFLDIFSNNKKEQKFVDFLSSFYKKYCHENTLFIVTAVSDGNSPSDIEEGMPFFKENNLYCVVCHDPNLREEQQAIQRRYPPQCIPMGFISLDLSKPFSGPIIPEKEIVINQFVPKGYFHVIKKYDPA